ncbi:MAG: ribonuclease D [Alphaproteobacteria bacterium]|nr:MAG: ribonuclease D [Alphaproteobacteria bacterium]
MELIADTESLRRRLARSRRDDYVALDTEFMRERSYWPKLCLIQVADSAGAFAIDPLAPDIDLAPFWELVLDWPGTKVFHACRQDMEIIYHATGRLPAPVFDTQVAAMVLGYGDSIAYDALVQKITGVRLSKGARFTDWSQRPLSDRQLAYALADVIHLRPVYEHLAAELARRGRSEWVREEMAVLTDPATYALDPDQAWRRLKLRRPSRRELARAQLLARWREEEAQRRDVPRNRVLKDEALLEVITHPPKAPADLDRLRGVGSGFHASRTGRALWRVLQEAEAVPKEDLPALPARKPRHDAPQPAVDMLKLLLKLKAAEADVAPRLIASQEDLERLAAGERDDTLPLLHGWRHDVFGRDALALLAGELRIGLDDGRIVIERRET